MDQFGPTGKFSKKRGAIHSTKISGNFGPKLNGSVRSNRKSFEKTGAIHSTKIQTGPTGKRGPPQKVDLFFETFPVGPNRSIEFWTEISGNFG